MASSPTSGSPAGGKGDAVIFFHTKKILLERARIGAHANKQSTINLANSDTTGGTDVENPSVPTWR